MIRINKKLALAASLTAVVVGLGTGVAFAAGDSDDNVSPASHAFTGTNSGNITFKGTIDFISVTVTCTTSSITGTTPASGLGPVNITPSFTNCTDSLGGTDTITIHGQWTLTFLDSTATNEETSAEGSGTTGDKLKVTIPKGGATFTSTANNCTITAAPSTSASISGTYDDVNKLTFSSASVPVSGDTCIASSSAVSGTYTSNPNIQDVS